MFTSPLRKCVVGQGWKTKWKNVCCASFFFTKDVPVTRCWRIPALSTHENKNSNPRSHRCRIRYASTTDDLAWNWHFVCSLQPLKKLSFKTERNSLDRLKSFCLKIYFHIWSFFLSLTRLLPASSRHRQHHLFRFYFRLRFVSAATWKIFLGINLVQWKPKAAQKKCVSVSVTMRLSKLSAWCDTVTLEKIYCCATIQYAVVLWNHSFSQQGPVMPFVVCEK